MKSRPSAASFIIEIRLPIRERMPDAKDPRTAVFIGEVRKLDPLNNLAYIYVVETFTGPGPGTLIEVEGRYAESVRYVQGQACR